MDSAMVKANIKHLSRIQLMRKVEEQSIETSSQLKAKDDVNIKSSSLQNPNDENATFCKKGFKSHQGYFCNISETASPDNPVQMITDVSLEPNINSNVNFLNDRLEEINIKAPLDKLVVDGAYYGSDSIKPGLKNENEIIPTEHLLKNRLF